MQFRICKPNSKQQGEENLRNKVADPQNNGILECLEKLYIKRTCSTVIPTKQKRLIILQSYKRLIVSAIAMKAQQEGIDKRPYLEECVNKEKWCDEHISILGIANRLNTTLCRRCHWNTPSQKFSKIVDSRK